MAIINKINALKQNISGGSSHDKPAEVSLYSRCHDKPAEVSLYSRCHDKPAEVSLYSRCLLKGYLKMF